MSRDDGGKAVSNVTLCSKTHPEDKTACGKTLRQECASKFKEEQAGLCGGSRESERKRSRR